KRLLREAGYESFNEIKKTLYYNHKIQSIEVVELPEPVAVYDLEVDEWHNVALECQEGMVYVHNSKATLAQEDIRFSRTINIIQQTMLAELNKIAIIHL